MNRNSKDLRKALEEIKSETLSEIQRITNEGRIILDDPLSFGKTKWNITSVDNERLRFGEDDEDLYILIEKCGIETLLSVLNQLETQLVF